MPKLLAKVLLKLLANALATAWPREKYQTNGNENWEPADKLTKFRKHHSLINGTVTDNGSKLQLELTLLRMLTTALEPFVLSRQQGPPQRLLNSEAYLSGDGL